ncbi:MAG TPA: cell division protein FtsA [Verrucomicrobia bacterium]|nr:cell division protein FtsA [Verrucomicrobiota bacterium]
MIPVVALEIGTSKTVALVGEMREDGSLMITGRGEHPSAGVKKGEITDPEGAANGAKKALMDAENGANVDINEVVLAITGGHIRSSVYNGTAPVCAPDGTICEDDMEEVQELARAVSLPADRDMIHTINQRYSVDDHEPVENPEGMVGAKLSLDILGFHGVRSILMTAHRTVERIQMAVQDTVFSGLAAALSVLTPEQKRSGAVVIDLGAGTTDYVAYAGGVIACGGSLAVGGDHVTNDIMLAFNIPQIRAEKIKKEHGRALVSDHVEPPRLSLPAELGFPVNVVNLRSLHVVVHARMEETLLKIRRRLEEVDVLSRLGGGVYLTGGGANMKDITELATSVLGVPCFVGRPRHVLSLKKGVDGPEYATCCGLLEYTFRTRDPQSDEPKSILGSLMKTLLGRR